MKYEILKDFNGSQDGRFTESFKADSMNVELSDSLAEVALSEGWAKIMEPEPAKPQKRKPGRPRAKLATKVK